jgi:hemoglobin-like flavoprotein
MLGPDIELLTEILLELVRECILAAAFALEKFSEAHIAVALLFSFVLTQGQKHVSYGVKAEYFPSMGRALIFSVQQVLPESSFNSDIKDSWVEIYGALSYDMIRAQKMV